MLINCYQNDRENIIVTKLSGVRLILLNSRNSCSLKNGSRPLIRYLNQQPQSEQMPEKVRMQKESEMLQNLKSMQLILSKIISTSKSSKQSHYQINSFANHQNNPFLN